MASAPVVYSPAELKWMYFKIYTGMYLRDKVTAIKISDDTATFCIRAGDVETLEYLQRSFPFNEFRRIPTLNLTNLDSYIIFYKDEIDSKKAAAQA